MVLSILLLALKIIGILLLGIIGILMFFILVLLFVPFRYKIQAEKTSQIDADIKVSWLFGIIKYVYVVKASKPEDSFVKLFGIKAWQENSKKPEKMKAIKKSNGKSKLKRKPKKEPKRETKPISEQTEKRKDSSEIKSENMSATDKNNNLNDERIAGSQKSEQPKTLNFDSKTEPTVTEKTKPYPEKKKKEKTKSKKTKTKRKHTKSALLDTFKEFWEYKYRKEAIAQVILFVKRIMKSIFNFKLSAELKIGTGSPDTTGQVIGMCCMLAGCTGLKIHATPDFNEKALEGSVHIKGRIFLVTLIWATLQLIFNKSIWPLVKKYVFS